MLRIVGVLVVLAGLLFIGYVGYGAWAESNAQMRAREFCEAISVGSPFADVVASARTTGEPRLRRITDTEVSVGFTGLPPFSRHFCRVRRNGEAVESVDYLHMD
jgi:hypothetical protein